MEMNDNEETALKFPCDFMLKVFGNASTEFEMEVLTIIRKHIPELRENAFTFRQSEDKKYLSITARFHVNTKEQLDNLYRELSSNPQVLMVL